MHAFHARATRRRRVRAHRGAGIGRGTGAGRRAAGLRGRDELRDARRDDRPGRHADLHEPRHARPARPGRPRRQVRHAARQRRPGGQGRGRREARARHLPVPLHAALLDAGRADRERRRAALPVPAPGEAPAAAPAARATPTRPTSTGRRPRGSTRATGRSTARTSRNTRDGGEDGPTPAQVDNLGHRVELLLGRGRLHRHAGRRARHGRRRHEQGQGPRAQRDDRQAEVGAHDRQDDQRHGRDHRLPRLRAGRRRRTRRASSRSTCAPAACCGTRSSTTRRTPTSTAARPSGTARSSWARRRYFGELNDPEVNDARQRRRARTRRPASCAGRPTRSPRATTAARSGRRPRSTRATRRIYVGTGNAYQEPGARDTTDSIARARRRQRPHPRPLPGDGGRRLERDEQRRTRGPTTTSARRRNLSRAPGGRQLVGKGQKSGTYWALDRETMDPVWSALTAPPSQTGGIVGSTGVRRRAHLRPGHARRREWALGRDGWLQVGLERRRPAALQRDLGRERRRLQHRHDRAPDRPRRGDRRAC